MRYFKFSRRIEQIFMLIFLGMTLLSACNDDDTTLVPLDTPNVVNNDATVSSLTFTWDKMKDATSYFYELTDPFGTIVAGEVTVSNTTTITHLQPSTTYTLSVYAYAAVTSSNTTSKVATLTATTADVITLDAPSPVAESRGNSVTISWNAIEHAGFYVYSYFMNNEEVKGQTTECSITLNALPDGEYHLSIFADSEDEAFSKSISATVTFTFTSVKGEPTIEDLCGTYTMQTSGSECLESLSWTNFSSKETITITKVDDNTISIKDPFYGYYEVLGTVDLQARTITIAPQEVAKWYILCTYNQPETGLIATFDEDFTITLENWTFYYEEYDYSYTKNCVTTYSK